MRPDTNIFKYWGRNCNIPRLQQKLSFIYLCVLHKKLFFPTLGLIVDKNRNRRLNLKKENINVPQQKSKQLMKYIILY